VSQTSLREMIGSSMLSALLSERSAADELLRNEIARKTIDWGISVKSVEIRDVAIPVALQTGNLDLRTGCKVAAITTDDGGQVTGIKYFDPNDVLHVQRARVVILSAFVFEHVRLLLLSKGGGKRFKNGLANSSGLVGKSYSGLGDSLEGAAAHPIMFRP